MTIENVYKWNKKNIKNKWILLISKIQENENDERKKYWDEYGTTTEYAIKEDKEIKYDGFTFNVSDNQIQYWIDMEKNNYDEQEEIDKFNEKCMFWNLGKYVENKIVLSINDNIDFDNFEFIEDEYFRDDFKNYLLTYNKKETYIKTDIINVIEVEYNERFDKKYVKLQNNDNILLFDFIKTFDDTIQEKVKEHRNNYNIDIQQYNYLSCIKEDDYQNNNYIELKVKNQYIEPKTYNNAVVYIKCNRLWSTNYMKKEEEVYSWGISLTIDKIIEN